MWESFRHLLVSEGIFALYSIILNAEKQESCICFWLMRVKRIFSRSFLKLLPFQGASLLAAYPQGVALG